MFLTTIPLIILSGYAAPIDNMPGWLQVIAQANPLAHFLVIVEGLFLKGMPLGDVFANLWPLLVIAAVALTARRCSSAPSWNDSNAIYISRYSPALRAGGLHRRPNYKKPPEVAMALNWSEPASTAAVDPAWWRSLGDPVLTDLLEAAAAHNLDLAAAAAQIREARANRDIAFGELFPQLNAGGSATRNELSANGEIPVRSIPDFARTFNLFDAGFDASWEIDFWGGNRRGLEAANARSASAQEATRSLKLEIIAEVAHTYIDLRSAQARLASARSDAQARTDTAALVELRYKAGDASAFDQARAESQARTVVSQLAALKSDARADAYSLALLTGRPPEALIELAGQSATWPTTPPTVGAGLRSELLRRRPDVRQAERDLAASTADIGVATADLFPKISLIGAIGRQAQYTGDLTSELSQR